MIALIACALLGLPSAIGRDAFGVPHVRAQSRSEAFYHAGYAVAEDRLWQMENSRRLARGRMAEVFGPNAAASDREILQTSYTDEELRAQFDKLGADAREALVEYARGVNARIAAARTSNALPSGYREAGFEPEPWDVLDSVAISIRLFHQFGRGGAGELRNLALLLYLQAQPNVGPRALEVLNDFTWQYADDIPTVLPEDDRLLSSERLQVTAEETDRHLALMPKVNLLELLPGLRLASADESTRLAESRSVVHRMGSYAVVVGAARSANRRPILLSAPQMGFRTPSIVHEIAIEAPGMRVVGMNVPGVPGVVIGHTPYHAWGLTSGVADTDDIFFVPMDGPDGYRYGAESRKLERIARTLRIKGQPDETVIQVRAMGAPVVVTSRPGNALFVRKSSLRMREMESFEALLRLYGVSSAAEIERAIATATMSFNFFYATSEGDIGYLYLGLVPQRAQGVDPRFPTPGDPRFEWRGLIPRERMPMVRNPQRGLIANWNNRPASWWPNLDTPVWGDIFRNELLENVLPEGPITPEDVEFAARAIAMGDVTYPYFAPFFEEATAHVAQTGLATHAADLLRGYRGQNLHGSSSARIYTEFVEALREEIFLPTTGNFLLPENFRMALQPTVIHRALQGELKFDYSRGRSRTAILQAAFDKAVSRLERRDGPDPARWAFAAPSFPVPSQPPVPYSERGTYIQIVELAAVPSGRSILPPGVAETGPHSLDQVPLARAWTFKPMRRLAPEGPSGDR
jgi:penicillin G amidase